MEFSKSIKNMRGRLINTLRNGGVVVDLCSVLDEKTSDDYEKFLGEFKYKFKCKDIMDGNLIPGQLSKVCYAINNITEEYDWYIKARPELIFHEDITLSKILNMSKDKINARVRRYEGPSIHIPHGISLRNPKKRDVKLGEKLIILSDDQFYIFHKNIAKIAFSYIDYSKHDEYLELYKDKNYDFIHPLKGRKKNGEREGDHTFFWNIKNIYINPIGCNLSMKWHVSSHLKI